MITFRTILVPILLMIPIELASFINMSMPYFVGENVIYMGYIIVGCIQLGATVDYSILMTNNYLLMRKQYSDKKVAYLWNNISKLSVGGRKGVDSGQD